MKTLITIDDERLTEFETLIRRQGETIAAIMKSQAELFALVTNFSRFYDLPEWITADDALAILRMKDKRTLNKAVAEGLIEMTGTGKIARFSKSACLRWAIANDRLLRVL